MTRAVAGAMALLGLLAGCRGDSDTVLLVVVTLSGSAPPVAALDVRLSGMAGPAEQRYAAGPTGPIAFPTTLVAAIPTRVAGDLTVDVRATSAGGETIASGRHGPFSLRVGTRQTIYVRLDCDGSSCTVDAGADGAPTETDGGAGGLPTCGNGRVDPGEICDTAIGARAPGACPRADCDDGIPCTTDRREGEGCAAACAHDEITAARGGDSCCPAGAAHADDTDCSATCGDGVVDLGETCDTALPPGDGRACPAPGSCDDGDACTRDLLVSAATCAAICLHAPSTAQSGATADGCCPAGAWHAVDVDCPVACGNGILEADETCELGLPVAGGGCPSACDDTNPCTVDVLEGGPCHARCAHLPAAGLVSGDGCCPTGASRAADADCPAACGNGVVEPGETCDDGAPATTPCPTTCPAAPSACVRRTLAGTASACTARCETALVTSCAATADGCCPAGCTAANDGDCSSTCGNGMVELARGERCDTAIAPGTPGACPTACADGNPCTQDLLVSAGTCAATCVALPVTAFRAGDGCCPDGADFALDADCAPVCGNGVAERPAETCDFAAADGACPAACPTGGACVDIRLEGAAGTCSSRCVAAVRWACAPGDGCCPPRCTIATDADCPPVCGDGVVSPPERCDRAVTAGRPGACQATCDDGDACTADFASGAVEGCSRACTHTRTATCANGDGCCPAGCTPSTDRDCGAVCGDGRVGAGETCDPPSSCPTTCPDDGDRCTSERLTGDPARCTAACAHAPVTACSGATTDLCCPTGCTAATDVDC